MAKVLVFENEEFEQLRTKMIEMVHEDFKHCKKFEYSIEYLRALERMEIKANDIIKGGR